MRSNRHNHWAIGPILIGLGGLGLRFIAILALAGVPASDAIAYLALGQSMADGHIPTDHFGQHGFYAIGYPLLLAPALWISKGAIWAAYGVNLVLALATAVLIWGAAGLMGLPRCARLGALVLWAIWPTSIWSATLIGRENLSAPLVLAVFGGALALLRGGCGIAFTTGLAWGGAILAGSSAIGVGAAPLIAIAMARGRDQIVRAGRRMVRFGALGSGLALMIIPWLCATQAMLGHPVLSTSSGFNFYIGNNPAANGRFVTMADTPIGKPRWNAMRRSLGEVGASHAVAGQAWAWIAAHPGQSTRLGMIKLALFWAPNVPDAADFRNSVGVASARVGEVGLYLLVLVLAVVGLIGPMLGVRVRLVLACGMAGYWLPHGIAYIIPRYREPIDMILILLAAAGATLILRCAGIRRFGGAAPGGWNRDTAPAGRI